MLALLILVGFVTGFLSGLLGIGGGIISVPALYYFLIYLGFPRDSVMHLSIATALASTFLTSLGSTWSHHKKKVVIFPILKLIAPGLLVGCIGGAILSHFLSDDVLKRIFGAMAILLAAFFFFPHLPHPRFGKKPNHTLLFWGVGVGCLSTLLGIGGGIFMVPILLGYALSIQNTIAVSAAGTLTTALLGTLLYLFIGWNEIQLPFFFGYIYLPGFLAIGFGSLLTTHWGAKLVHSLPTPLIKRIFASALAATGITMMLGS